MKTNVKVTQDTRRTRLDGTCPVRLCVTTKGTRIYIATGITCSRKDFEPKGGRNGVTWIKGNDDANRTLMEHMKQLQERTRNMTTTDTKEMKRICNGDTATTTKVPYLAETLQELADTKTGRTRASYMQTRAKVLKHYPQDIRMADVTRAHLDAFASRERQTISVNSVALHLTNIRTAYNYVADMGMCQAYPFRRYHIKRETTRKRSLTLEQLHALMAYDGTERENTARDMFMLSFFLIGMNPADMLNLAPQDMEHGRIMYNRHKTGRFYSIAVQDVARAIIEKHQGTAHLLKACDTWKDYTQYMHRVNDDLHKIGTQLPGHVPSLTMYWARHTWATIASYLDVPDTTISQALGHSYTNPVTAIYINRDARKIDDANDMVVRHVLNADARQSELLKAQ